MTPTGKVTIGVTQRFPVALPLLRKSKKLIITSMKSLTESVQSGQYSEVCTTTDKMETLLQQLVGIYIFPEQIKQYVFCLDKFLLTWQMEEKSLHRIITAAAVFVLVDVLDD